MSKNKEKHNVHEGAGGGNRPAHRSPLGEGGTTDPASPGGYAGQATDQKTDDGLGFAQGLRPGERQMAVGDGVPSADTPPAIPAPAEAVGQTEKLAQLQDRLLRLQADFDNFRKRTLREKNELFDSANQALMLELLTVLDHLHLGIQAASTHQADPAFQEGLTLILDQLMGVLSKFGLSPIETEKQAFDPNRFEAVNALPSATEPEGTILALVRRGYMLRNKLLRPAQVIVSSGPPPEEKADDRRQTTDAGQEKTKDGCQKADGGKE